MIDIALEPVDTLFFRDGTPFSAGDSPQQDVASLFPPHPASVLGAIRASLAVANGWSGHGRWPERFNAVLGDGPDDLGSLVMAGPFVLQKGRPLFPMPRHVLGSVEEDRWDPRVLLRPGSAVKCDLGNAVRLPEPSISVSGIERCKSASNLWLTLTGFRKVLRRQLPSPDEVISSSRLWNEEPRTGLKRDRITRTSKEGMLYSTRHVRLVEGVSIGARIDGVPEAWTIPLGRLLPLGGESRLAACRQWIADLDFEMPLNEIVANGRAMVIALTPLDLNESICWGRQPLNLPGNVRVVSACLNRPQRIGGWDSLGRRPLPLRSLLPPSSVLFCEVNEPRRFIEAIVMRDGLVRLGSRQRWGFGVAALGTWSYRREVNE